MSAWINVIVGFFLGLFVRDLILRERFIVYEKRIDMYLATWAHIADAYVSFKQFALVALRAPDDSEFEKARARADSCRYEAVVTLEKNRLILDETLFATCDQLLRTIWTYIASGSGSNDPPKEQEARRQHEERVDVLYYQAERQAKTKVQGWTRRLELFTDKCRRWGEVAWARLRRLRG